MAEQLVLYPIAWACLSSWYYGYHLSELNFPSTSLTCLSPAFPPPSRLPLCLGIGKFLYGVVTASFTVGGLAGSLMSSWVVQHEGVKGGITWSGYLNLIGVLGMGIAPHWMVLALGRFVSGLAGGLAVCLVPPFLSSLARASPALAARTGQIGTLHQMGIVIGLFSAQLAGLIFTGSQGDIPGNWRYVVVVPGLVSAAQIFVASRIAAPEDAHVKVPSIPERTPTGQLSPVLEADETAESPLLPDSSNPPTASHISAGETQLPLRSLLSNSALRTPTLLCAAIMSLQQLSGVNAVMFYSTPVLRPLMPGAAGQIGLYVTFVNALMTVVAILLVDRMGRKSLLLVSVGGMGVTSAMLAYALNEGYNLLSAVNIIFFIVFFSIGLGPIPFLLLSELAPPPAIPALASLSLSVNWTTNFLVAIAFLPLRDALSTPVDPRDPLSERVGEGTVFYVFTGVLVVLFLVVWRGLGARSPAEGGGR